jgi:hypothetical protein
MWENYGFYVDIVEKVWGNIFGGETLLLNRL